MPKSDLILLALDDPQLLKLLEHALVAASFEMAVAGDRAALDKALQETTPALLIIGERFKDHSGLEISGELLERFPTLPILLFANQGTPAVIKEALRVGISDCLCPPMHSEEILRAAENSLKRAQRIGDWTRREVKRTTASLEQQVKELQKLETILTHIEGGVMILDEAERILLTNPAMRTAFGLGDSKLSGRPVREVVQHPDLNTLLENSGRDPLKPHEIHFADGRAFNAHSTPIPQIGVAITMEDITYLKALDRLKSDFVYTVSHDLRSPLTAILGYIELLDRVGPLNDHQREFVQRVQASVQSITDLVNNLLDLGRIEAGFDTQKEVIPLEGILRYTLDTISNQITEKKQNLCLEMPAHIPYLLSNPIRLRQMLDNLLGNAIKYTPEGGDVSIKVEVEGDQVILCISDTGPGIPPADQPHIFDKFYRAGNIPKDVPGSGLGLAIVKSIVDNHSGRIWVESTLGKGSTFTVVLPIYRPEKPQPPSV